MILHLSAAGVPISWSITALYRSSYGIAHASATGWYERSLRDAGDRPRSDSPQYLCELAGDEESGYTVKRDDLWMAQDHLQRQGKDDGAWLVQLHTAPTPLSDRMGAAVTDALRARLTAFGYLIPRDEWMRRYPAQAMIAARFREFNEAYDAWKKANPDAPERMPFEPRWAPFMEMPKGYKLPYSRGEDCICARRSGGRWARIDPTELAGMDLDGLDAIIRLLNSGWTPAEVKVLLADEPID